MARRPTEAGINDRPEPSSQQRMAGKWVGSFSGVIRNEPRHNRSNEMAQIPGFLFVSNSFPQVQGYFPCAAILGLEFKSDGTLSGEYRMNAATRVTSEPLTGTYELSSHPTLGIDVGTFTLAFRQSIPPNPVIEQFFQFMMCGRDEMHFLAVGSARRDSPTADSQPNRVTIAQGVLHRAVN